MGMCAPKGECLHEWADKSPLAIVGPPFLAGKLYSPCSLNEW